MNRLACAVLVCAASLALAQDPPAAAPAAPAQPPPSADEIKRVLDYQENGKDRGPALLDLQPCLKVDQTNGSPTKNTCIEPIAGPVKKGTTVTVWLQFFCPKGGLYEDLRLKWLDANGETYNTNDVKVEGLARTRSWRAFTPKKAGKWTARLVRGEGDAMKTLGEASFTIE